MSASQCKDVRPAKHQNSPKLPPPSALPGAAGESTITEGVVVNRITLWQGQQWHESESGVDAAVLCMTPAPDGATLVIAGEFTSVSGSTAQHVVESGCTLAIKGDVNGDGAVNVTDLRAVIQFWGPRAPNPSACPANIAPPTSGDGHVNVTELLLVMSDWRP